MSQTQFSLEAFIFIFILIIYILAAHFIDVRKVPYIHESGIAIIMGFATALSVYYATDKEIQFNNDIFFSIILPPIIFSAGYSLRKSLFFQHFGVISFLGIFGTVIGFACIAIFLNFLDDMFFNTLSLKQILMVSSVLCATDTVAAISLIKPEKFPALNAVLFGQGIINDAVAIILFRTIQKADFGGQNGEGFSYQIVLAMMFDFFLLLIFSLITGAAAGFGLSYLLKVNDSMTRSPIKQTSLILLTGYATYLLGQFCGFSGIITLFTCSIIMGHYTFMNISVQAQRGTGLAFETVAYVAQAFIYAYLGASIFSISGKWSAFGFSLLLIPIFPFVRGLMVYLLPCIYKITKKQFPLKSNQLKVCWYSGMVRGVIAFALSLQIESQNIQFIQTISVVIVMATTLVGASMLKTFMKCIKMDSQNQKLEEIGPQNIAKINDNLLQQSEYNKIDSENNHSSNSQTLPQKQRKLSLTQENSQRKSFKQRFKQFQSNYVVPIFKKPKAEAFTYELMAPQSSQKKTKKNNEGI